MEESGAKIRDFDQNYTSVVFFLSLFCIFLFQWTILEEIFFGGDAFEDDDEEDYYIASSVHWIVIVIIKSSSS